MACALSFCAGWAAASNGRRHAAVGTLLTARPVAKPLTAMMSMAMIGVVVAGAVLAQVVLPPAHAANPEPGAMVFKFGSMGTGDGEFGDAYIPDVDIGPNGNIYAVDVSNDRIQVFHPDGAFAFKFFSSGYRVSSIAVGPNGNIFVGGHNDAVEVFHPNGSFAFQIKPLGSGGDYLDHVANIAVGPNGNIFVGSSYGNQPVHAFHPNGSFAFKLGLDNHVVSSIAVAPNGTIALLYTDEVGMFNPDGTVASYPLPLHGIGGRVNDIDFGPRGEVVVGHSTGVTLFYPNLTSVVTFTYRVSNTGAVAVGPTGMIAVAGHVSAGYAKHTIREIRVYNGLESSGELRPSSLISPTLDGGRVGDGGANGRSPAYVPPVLYPSLTGSMFAFEFGSRGSGAGEFMGPHNIAVGPGGVIAVSDMGNQRVQVFYPNGTFAFEFGSYGSGAGEFMGPYDLAFGPYGLLVVSDHGNNRVQAFRIQ